MRVVPMCASSHPPVYSAFALLDKSSRPARRCFELVVVIKVTVEEFLSSSVSAILTSMHNLTYTNFCEPLGFFSQRIYIFKTVASCKGILFKICNGFVHLYDFKPPSSWVVGNVRDNRRAPWQTMRAVPSTIVEPLLIRGPFKIAPVQTVHAPE